MNTLHHIRPRLRQIAPLTFTNVILFAWLNLFIAISLIQQSPNPQLVIAGTAFRSYFWAGFFLMIGAGHLLGIVTNNWRTVRWSLSMGLFVKLVFTYALIVLGFKVGFKQTMGTTALWLGITWVQFFTLKYFEKQRLLNVK